METCPQLCNALAFYGVARSDARTARRRLGVYYLFGSSSSLPQWRPLTIRAGSVADSVLVSTIQSVKGSSNAHSLCILHTKRNFSCSVARIVFMSFLTSVADFWVSKIHSLSVFILKRWVQSRWIRHRVCLPDDMIIGVRAFTSSGGCGTAGIIWVVDRARSFALGK